MKVWSAIFNMIGAMLILFMCVCYFNIAQVIERDFDQIRLNYAVEYATRAMFTTTLQSEDLEMDYTDLSQVQIDSSDALDIFCSLLCLSYDMALSEQNFVNIENSIAACVLAGSDGYYVGQMRDWDYNLSNDKTQSYNRTICDVGQNPSFGKRLNWSIKMPYFIRDSSGNTVYGVGYKNGVWRSATKNLGTVLISDGGGYPMGITDDMIQNAVDTQLREAIMVQIQDRNLNGNGFDFKFYLPDVTTVNGVNKIEPPAILVLMEGVDFASKERISALSVAGFKVIKRVSVVAFKDVNTGRQYYCFESQLLDEEKVENGGPFEIVNYYRTMHDAAKEGYSPYFDILVRKILVN